MHGQLKTWQASQVGRVRLHLIYGRSGAAQVKLKANKNLSLPAAFTIHGFTGLVRRTAGWQSVDANLRATHGSGQALGDLGRGGDGRRHGSGRSQQRALSEGDGVETRLVDIRIEWKRQHKEERNRGRG